MPMLQCELAAGDWLYIPHGYWHKADARSDSLSLAVGVMMPSALDVLDFARRRLVESIRWRQRLPMSDGDDPQSQAELFAELGARTVGIILRPGVSRDNFGNTKKTRQALDRIEFKKRALTRK